MRVNVKQFLTDAGISEPLYPGKRMVHALRQSGEFKSHCVVLDWRLPETLRIDVKPGLSGRDLEVAQVKNYPICFQTPTYIEIAIVNDNDDKDDDKEKGETSKGKGKASGGGSKGQKKGMMNKAFSALAEGKVPDGGKIVEMVVMGMKVASQAYASVLKTLTEQIHHAKITATELLAQAGNFITKYTPPSFLQPKGNENAVYKYDAEKNFDIGYTGPALG